MSLTLVGLETRAQRRSLDARVGGAGHATSEREALSLDVHVEHVRGARVGRGEAAPLPGYSLDTLELAQAALDGVRASLPWTLPADDRLVGALSASTSSLPPSARAALETALLDAAGQALGRPLWSFLRAATPWPLPVCAMLDAPTADLAAQSRALLANGAAAQKRKLDPTTAEATLDALAALGAPRPRLRLDANRAFAPEAFVALIPRLAALRPSFMEEPFDGDLAEELARRGELAPLRYAADESLAALTEGLALAQLRRFRSPIERGRLTTVVLKPARDGLLGALALGRLARQLGASVVVTHAWDGPRGHRAAIHLALALGEADSPAQGLWPHAGLEGDTLDDVIVAGRLIAPSRSGLGACA